MDGVVKDRAWWTEWQLENWRRYMESGGLPDELPDHASGGAENATSMDWESCESAYQEMDAALARTTNAVIDDLEPMHQAAICNAYLAMVWRFQRTDFQAILKVAKLRLADGLVRKGVWMGEK
jgi:hypothetical protein